MLEFPPSILATGFRQLGLSLATARHAVGAVRSGLAQRQRDRLVVHLERFRRC